MQQSFFDVTPLELSQLGPEPAVAVLREMLWAEVRNLGIPISDTDVPFSINDADGGVDAVVKGTAKEAGNGLIFPPMTSYQVKAGDFALHTPAQIEALLMTPTAVQARRAKAKTPITGSLHTVEGISPRVRACLDAGGTFVTVLFGNDSVETEEAATESAIRTFLGEIDAKYKGAKVRVWRQSRICGLLRAFPGVSLQIKNRADLGLLSHDQWTTRLDMRQAFVAAPDQQKVMEGLRAAIRDDSQGTIHIRLIGEPGVGKTRLILETLCEQDLKPLVLYAEKGSDIDGSVMAAIRAASHARVILVVDECNADMRSSLTRSFGGSGPNLTIVSIYQDEEDGDRSSEYRLFAVPLLPTEEIEAILKSYGVDPAYAKGWAEMCDGSPRVAHVVGQNLRDDPADPLRGDGLSMIWARYLAGDVDRMSDAYRQRHLVLSSMALFKRFGWSPAVNAGAYEVFDLIISKLNLITHYPQPSRYGTKQEHTAVSAGLNDGAQQGAISKGAQRGSVCCSLRNRGSVPGGGDALALAIRLCLPGLRRAASQLRQDPGALPVYRLSAADIRDRRNDFRSNQDAAVHLVSRHLPPHSEQGRHLQH